MNCIIIKLIPGVKKRTKLSSENNIRIYTVCKIFDHMMDVTKFSNPILLTSKTSGHPKEWP